MMMVLKITVQKVWQISTTFMCFVLFGIGFRKIEGGIRKRKPQAWR